VRSALEDVEGRQRPIEISERGEQASAAEDSIVAASKRELSDASSSDRRGLGDLQRQRHVGLIVGRDVAHSMPAAPWTRRSSRR
jgi:hypothetical protein